MANEIIRVTAKRNGVNLWEIGDRLGVSEATITRKLRRELNEEDRSLFLGVIEEVAHTKKAGV